MGDNGGSGGEAFDWEDVEDITALFEGKLRARLEEWAVSYRREILRGKIDEIRAQLAGVLMGERGSP